MTGPEHEGAGHPRRTVWFDFGGVLSPSLDDLFLAFEKKTGIGPAQMAAALGDVGRELGVPPLVPVELGRMAEAEWAGRISSALRSRWPGLDQSLADWAHFGRQWFEGVEANVAVAGAAQTLRDEGLRVAVLSNNVKEWEPYWRPLIGPEGAFDPVVDSCVHGVRKPQPEIFTLAERLAGTEGQDCVLVDDLEENCRAAEAAGWTTVHFRETGQALRELSAVTGVRLCPLP
ncbi:HAD family phosphatase [Streptomyces sp. NBC_01218]|uniref:HAD family hydrolase n=1 Tax=Streptomyces sp. NBC_01218 TaxID=2903780 RepID=UPI002E132DC7|nr:HAD family phosphatase [Streptomyces sp. NBC_01218]